MKQKTEQMIGYIILHLNLVLFVEHIVKMEKKTFNFPMTLSFRFD